MFRARPSSRAIAFEPHPRPASSRIAVTISPSTTGTSGVGDTKSPRSNSIRPSSRRGSELMARGGQYHCRSTSGASAPPSRFMPFESSGSASTSNPVCTSQLAVSAVGSTVLKIGSRLRGRRSCANSVCGVTSITSRLAQIQIRLESLLTDLSRSVSPMGRLLMISDSDHALRLKPDAGSIAAKCSRNRS